MFLILLVDVWGPTSNSLFDTLTEWEAYLKSENVDFDTLVQDSSDEPTSQDIQPDSDAAPAPVSTLVPRGPSL